MTIITISNVEEKGTQGENGASEVQDISMILLVDNDTTKQRTDVATEQQTDDAKGQPMDDATRQPEEDVTGQPVLQPVEDYKPTGRVSECLAWAAIVCFYIPVYGFTVVLPLTGIITGFVHMFDCPAQWFIPVHLIAGGCVLLVNVAIVEIKIIVLNNKAAMGVIIFDCAFLVIWLVTGFAVDFVTCVNSTTADPTISDYCHPNLCGVAYIVITIVSGLLCLAIVSLICGYVDDHLQPKTQITVYLA